MRYDAQKAEQKRQREEAEQKRQREEAVLALGCGTAIIGAAIVAKLAAVAAVVYVAVLALRAAGVDL